MRRHLLRCTSPLFGTFRKRGGFRLESGMRAKAHLGRSVRINGFTPQVSGDAVYCLNSLVSSPMPSIATVTVLTGSFITPTPTDVPQAIRSPGRSVMSCEILLTSS
jgi:hypothetical protein